MKQCADQLPCLNAKRGQSAEQGATGRPDTGVRRVPVENNGPSRPATPPAASGATLPIDKDSPTKGMVSFVPNSRLKSVLVIS